MVNPPLHTHFRENKLDSNRHSDVEMDMWCFNDGLNKKRNNYRQNKSGRNIQENAGTKVKVVRTFHEKG